MVRFCQDRRRGGATGGDETVVGNLGYEGMVAERIWVNGAWWQAADGVLEDSTHDRGLSVWLYASDTSIGLGSCVRMSAKGGSYSPLGFRAVDCLTGWLLERPFPGCPRSKQSSLTVSSSLAPHYCDPSRCLASGVHRIRFDLLSRIIALIGHRG